MKLSHSKLTGFFTANWRYPPCSQRPSDAPPAVAATARTVLPPITTGKKALSMVAAAKVFFANCRTAARAWSLSIQYVWPNYYIGPTFQSEVIWLKDWITNRLNWMDANMPSVITGVAENNRNLTVAAFPNPFNKEIIIDYKLEMAGTFGITLFDLLGRPVLTATEHQIQAGAYQLILQAQGLPAGAYYYKATSESGSTSGKVIKCE